MIYFLKPLKKSHQQANDKWERFPVASHWPYGVTMAEVQGRDDLSEELPGLFGGEPTLLHQVIK